jgi:TrmH family RNA methyltransferase
LFLKQTDNNEIFRKQVISKNQIKNITALSHKKMRDETGLFVAEGSKLVIDLEPAFKLKECYATSEWLQNNRVSFRSKIQEVSADELKKISSQKSPQGILAIFEKPNYNLTTITNSELCLALDDIQDPGNLGTIIRIADWFGIKNIVCSHLSADAFGHKTVQATMGALARVNVHYVDLLKYIQELPNQYPIYGTFMDGNDLYTEALTPNGLIVMGNEGNGISHAVSELINHRLTIPSFPKNEATSESLNVAVATSIVCAEFRRRLK